MNHSAYQTQTVDSAFRVILSGLNSGQAMAAMPDPSRLAQTRALGANAIRLVRMSIESDRDGIDVLDPRAGVFQLLVNLSDHLLDLAADCLPDSPVVPPPSIFNLSELMRAVLPPSGVAPLTHAAFPFHPPRK